MTYSKNRIYLRIFKRPFDLLLSLIAFIVLSPLFLIVALLVRTKLGSPIFFKQERPGLNEEIFVMYKFRTMSDKKDESGNLLPDEDRLTNFGKFLRSTSLDEVPSLLNIFFGEMSFVGPRPLLVRYLPYYYEEERGRSRVRPGITGLAQINGRNALTWNERFQIDNDYIDSISFILDIKIIVNTFLVVLKRRDILVGSEHILEDLDVERRLLNDSKR